MMKPILLFLLLFSFNVMAADVFPGFESEKEIPVADNENKGEKVASEVNPQLEVNRRLDDQRANAIEQRTFDNLKRPTVHGGGKFKGK